MSWTRRLRRLARRPAAEQRLLLEAAFLLGIAKVATALLPFRGSVRLAGLVQGQTAIEPHATQAREAELVGWAVSTAAAHVPWHGTCLTQALVASRLLRSRGIPGIVHLGVAKDVDAEDGLAAHAWLRCGGAVLVGESGHARFTTVATYRVGPQARRGSGRDLPGDGAEPAEAAEHQRPRPRE